MRIGFNYVRDLGEDGRKAIVTERARGAYTSFDNFIDRLRGGPIGPRAVRNLVMVGAFDGLGQPTSAGTAMACAKAFNSSQS